VKKQVKQKYNCDNLASLRDNSRQKYCVPAGRYKIALGEKTKIMGVVNMTPDSFSSDGLYKKSKNDLLRAVDYAQKLIHEGADIVDIGGESTRPGSVKISETEEIKRVVPLIGVLAKKIKVPISVDTYKSNVARAALDKGAVIVNDIMGAKKDDALFKMVRDYKAAIVLMHIRNTPENMQKNIRYKNLISEICSSLRNSVENCLEIGIKLDRIIIDPGICFGKTVKHNLEIINRLNYFNVLNCPILIGTSRKSFIGKVLNKDVNGRLVGTIASACASVLNGAHILRVHDVKEIKEAVTFVDAVINKGN